MKRTGMKGRVRPPVCPARSRLPTSRHSSARHFLSTRPARLGAWKRSTSTLCSRRARDALPAHA
jgi:hypothetical protein